LAHRTGSAARPVWEQTNDRRPRIVSAHSIDVHPSSSLPDREEKVMNRFINGISIPPEDEAKLIYRSLVIVAEGRHRAASKTE
jgi:hypothetical protein